MFPSRIFDADDVREGPGLDGIDEYMASTFPGMVQISVSEQLKHYLRPGGLLAAYELYGQRDPVAHSLALARSAPTTPASHISTAARHAALMRSNHT